MAEENEKKDSSAVGKANSAYRSYKNAKRAYNTVKAARTGMMAAEGISAAATSEVWVPVVIIGLIIVVIIIILFGGVSGVKGGDLSNSPPPTGGNNSGSTVQPMPVDEVAKYFTFDTNVSSGNKSMLFSIIAPAFGSKQFVKLLTADGTSRKISLSFFSQAGNKINGGANYDNNTMKFWGFFDANLNSTYKAHIFIHELGHLLDRRNGRISDGNTSYGGARYSQTSLVNNDPSCYDNYCRQCKTSGGASYIKTYAYRDVCKVAGGGAIHESFAESLANYVFCKPGSSCDYNDIYCSEAVTFNGTCNSTNKWFRDNIFGGDDFFASQGSSTQGNPTSTTNFPKTPKSNTNCDGTPAGKYGNFGNPNCDFSRDKLYQLLQQLDKGTTKTNTGKIRTNVDIWYNSLIPHESGYDPNAVALHSASGRGAYGLFQMNPNGYSSTYDSGNVEWHWQVTNAINKENSLSALCKWQYWGAVANGQVVDKVTSCR